MGPVGLIGPMGQVISPTGPIGPIGPIPRSSLIVEELANVSVARIAHLLIATAEDDVPIPQHDEFSIYQAHPVAFVLEDQVAVIVAHDVLAGQYLDVLQTVRDEDRGDLFQVA